jgi:hypothetical protein
MKRQLVSLLLLVCFSAFNPIPANAWGPNGHRIVAIIAARHLKPKTKKAIEDILGKDVTLASVANYADAIRNSKPETKNFHYVDIPKDATNYVESRDCKDTEKGDCVIKALERFSKQVVDQNESLASRRFALKFIVHLVGDLHQPLHCADNHDVGGNNVSVTWFGKSTNLHKVWDSAIINEAELSDDEFADALDDELTDQQVAAIENGTVLSWVLESHKAAHDFAYVIPASHALSQTYYDRNAPVVDRQLLRAGLRLAKVLNFIFK